MSHVTLSRNYPLSVELESEIIYQCAINDINKMKNNFYQSYCQLIKRKLPITSHRSFSRLQKSGLIN